MFDVKLARDHSIVIVVSSLMALISSKRECDQVFVNLLCGMTSLFTLAKFCDVICINPRGFML